MKKDLVVIGLGNPLMSDEGIGVRVVERLSQVGGEKWPDVEFVDAGTGGLSILYHIEGRRKAILIDCAFMGAEPGVIRRFNPDEVESTKALAHQSLHEMDVLKVLEMSSQLGQSPEEVVIFGIEPEVVESGLTLSETLNGQLEHYISVIIEELGV